MILRLLREEENQWWGVIVSNYSERIRALVLRGRRINLLLALGINRRLLFHADFKDGAAIIWAKAKSGLLPGQDR